MYFLVHPSFTVEKWGVSGYTFHGPVVDLVLEGVWVVCLNPPVGPNYFIFMAKFMKKIG